MDSLEPPEDEVNIRSLESWEGDALGSENGHMKEPVRNPNVWVVSCRSVRSREEFSKRVLLYQPDVRNFCPRGINCSMQDDEVHCALYRHGLRGRDESKTVIENPYPPAEKEVLRNRYKKTRIDTYSDSYLHPDQSGTTRFLSDLGTNTDSARIPHVSKAWQLGFSNSITKNFKPGHRIHGIPQDKTLVVFCHGFNERFPRIVAYLLHMCKVLNIDSKDANSPVNLAAFTWPSQRVPMTYFRARHIAEQAGTILRKTLQLLSFHGNRIILIGHSLGCRVCLHSLLDWNKSPSTKADTGLSVEKYPIVEHLYLLAAGIGADELSIDGKFPANRIGSEKITVCYSKKDPIKVGFGFAELIPGIWNLRPKSMLAMGVVGIRGHIPLSENGETKCDSVNCTSEVPAHSVHFYFKSAIFSKMLVEKVAHVEGKRLRSRL
mmetsp:Transcript_6775/g.8249  ORF Transcript_6775/g.8249 Transcript_6775/m.8249 type:complete len:434 (-) Transcript_6775:269-1570(-)